MKCSKCDEEKQTFFSMLKEKLISAWNKMDSFGKIATIAAILIVLLLVVAICVGKALPIIVSILQTVGIVVAILLHNGKIASKEKWLKYVILVVAILLSIINIASYSVGINAAKPSSATSSPTIQPSIPPHESAENEMADTICTTSIFPIGSDECIGKDYATIMEQLQEAGFENVHVEKVEDLKASQKDQLNTIASISVDGNSEFAKGQEAEKTARISILYHGFAECHILMNIDFIPNLIFNKYDVKLKLDGSEQVILEHGEDGDYEFAVYPGTHTFDFVKKDSPSIEDSITLEVKGDINIGLKICCYSDKIDIDIVFMEDWGALEDGQVIVSVDASDYRKQSTSDISESLASFGFTNISLEPVYDVSTGSANIGVAAEVLIDGKADFKRGDIFASDASVVIKYHEDEAKDPIEIAAAETVAALEKNLPKEMARRTVIVAMTNCQATDVFASDGNTLDPNKFHSYDDIGDFFMTVEKEGEWTALDENTWHVEGIVLRIYDYDTYLKASGNVQMDGENYIFYNVDRNIATKEYIDSTDPSKTYVEHFEPSDLNSFLTVPVSLIIKDRDNAAAQEKMTAKETRQKWIESQFNWWDGRHEALSDLIKDNLNDSKSFKHVDVSYIDICDEERQSIVNDTLQQAGFSERVEIGDLFVMETFTAKNGFNATIKSIGYGIVHSDGTVVLLGIA